MPQVIPFVVGFVQGVGAGLGISAAAISYTASAAQVAGYVAGTSALGQAIAISTITTGVSMAAQAVMMDNMQSEGAPGSLSNVIDPMPASRTIYGKTRTGGVMVFAKATRGYTNPVAGSGTNKNQILHLVIELAGHPCEAIDQIYLGNTALNPVQVSALNPVSAGEVFPSSTAGVDANGVTRYTSAGTDYDGEIGMKIYKGSQLLADQDLRDALTVQADGDVWSANHIGYEKTYVYIRLHFKANLFRGIPQFTFDVRGKNTIDFLGGGASYTINPIMCLYDYMTMDKVRGGFGVEASAIDNATWQAAANRCNETVTIRAGETQNRYFCGGIISSGQEPQDIMRSLLEACAGVMEWVNGKWYVWAYNSTDIVAQMTLTESELLDFPTWQLNRSSKDAVNSIKPVIRSTETAWQPSSVESVEVLRKLWGTTSFDTMTVSNHGLVNGDRVKFVWWTGTTIDNSLLPAGITAETYYYVVQATTNTFKVSGTAGGSPITLGTSSGGELTAIHDIYLSQDGERNSQEQGFTMVNDPVMARRLSIINLRQIRQEISGVIICKPGTAYAVPADLFVGDTIRVLNNEMSFYEAVTVYANKACDATFDTITASSHGLSNHDAVVFSSIPSSTGISQDRIYYVRDAAASTFKLAEYRGGPVVDIKDTAFSGVDFSLVQGKLFRVVSYKPIIDSGIYSIELGLRETATNIYDWTDDREIAPEATPGITVPSLYDVEDVTSLAAFSGTNELYQKKDGTVITRVRLTWDATDDEYIAASGKIEIQYKLSSASEWSNHPDLPGSTTEAYIIDVTDGENYDFRARFRNAFGKEGGWGTPVTGHTVLGKTVAPTAPSSFTATYVDGGDRIDLSWTNPSDLDLSHTQIGRSISYVQGLWTNNVSTGYDTFDNGLFYPDGFEAIKTQTSTIAKAASSFAGGIFSFAKGATVRIQFVFNQASGNLPTVYGINSAGNRCTDIETLTYTPGSGSVGQFIDTTVYDDTHPTASERGPCRGWVFESAAGDAHTYSVVYFNSRSYPEYEIVAEVPAGTTRGQTTAPGNVQTWTDAPIVKGSSSRTVYYQIKSVDTSGNISTATVRDDVRIPEWPTVQNFNATNISSTLRMTWTDSGSGGTVILSGPFETVRVPEFVQQYDVQLGTGTYTVQAQLAYPFNGLEFVSRPVFDTATVTVPIPTAIPDYYYVRP